MITKVYDYDGNLVHDCEELGCTVSWDGKVIDAGRFRAEFTPEEADRLGVSKLKTGQKVPGAGTVGDEWDTSQKGIAREK